MASGGWSGLDGLLGPTLADLAQPNGSRHPGLAADLLDGPHVDVFFEAVIHHRLQASLASTLDLLGREQPGWLADMLLEDRLTRLRIKQALQKVTHAMGTEIATDPVPWVVLKGVSLAVGLTRPELRSYNDLDILVPPNRLAEAIDRLESYGFVMLNRNWEPYRRHLVGELPLMSDNATIDLHWDLVALARERRDLRFPTTEMVDRSRWISIDPAIRAPVLSPEDQLLHVTTHCALSGAVRLDHLRDVRAVVESAPYLDWGLVVDRANAIGVSRLVGHTLDRASRIMDLDVGVEALDQLAGRSSLRVRRAIDRDRITTLRRLPVSVWRDTTSAVGRSLITHIESWWRTRRGTARIWDFTRPDSALYYDRPSGGPNGMIDFLTDVSRGYGRKEP